MQLIHVTHEAVHKIGGIGAVIEGLITAPAYSKAVERSLLVCPLFGRDGAAEDRLGPGGEVAYSSVDGKTQHPLEDAFRAIQHRYGVEIVYGRRLLRDPLTGAVERPEVVLIDVNHCRLDVVNELKGRLYKSFGLMSSRYEDSWDYEMYTRLAEPALATARALGLGGGPSPCFVVAHEYMGLPTALAAKLRPELGILAAYYAHEAPTARKIVESHSGHDTMFYNVLELAAEQGKYVADVFGDQSGYFRHGLTEASRHVDVTLAVGDHVVRELLFLSPEMARSNIKLTYNGIPAYHIETQECLESKSRLADYAEALLGDRPDYVFTHVTRLISSKALWRDLLVMKYVEEAFRRAGKTAVLLVLSTEIGGPRRPQDILEMEKWWDWPVAHRECAPDLSEGEAVFSAGVQAFNARARQCKVVFINQFGFERKLCGTRMPAEMKFWDIRRGSDVEFGQSVYEPFGIAQVEALSFGAICVMSAACGCTGFVARAAGDGGTPNAIIADYGDYPAIVRTIETYLSISREDREKNDDRIAAIVAREVIDRLPKSREEKAAFVRRGYELASKMSWDVVAEDYLLPALREAAQRASRAAGAA